LQEKRKGTFWTQRFLKKKKNSPGLSQNQGEGMLLEKGRKRGGEAVTMGEKGVDVLNLRHKFQ